MDLIWQLVQPIIGELAILGVILGGLFGLRASAKRAGRMEQEAKAKEKDHADADALRRTVDRNLDQRVREMDGRGYRD